jgi:hypothetical protein
MSRAGAPSGNVASRSGQDGDPFSLSGDSCGSVNDEVEILRLGSDGSGSSTDGESGVGGVAVDVRQDAAGTKIWQQRMKDRGWSIDVRDLTGPRAKPSPDNSKPKRNSRSMGS